MTRSIWLTAYTGSEGAKKAARSWFAGMMPDNAEIISAEILVDRETEDEKGQMRVVTIEGASKYQYTRRRTKAGFTIDILPLKS